MADILNVATENASESLAPAGHDAAMLAAVDNVAEVAPLEVATPEPELILGKFKTQEDFEAAYKALETKQSQGTEDNTADVVDTGTPEDANEAVKSAGLNMEELTASYDANGDLSVDQYAALEAAGFDRDVVENYMTGQEAQAELMQNKVFDEVGGQAQYEALTGWAKDSLTQAELVQYNDDMATGDFEKIKSAVQLLNYRYEAVEGKLPNLILGDTKGGSTGTSFNSVAQLTAAMADPQYHKDPAYRADVEKRLANSDIM
jgi:hypothetical protein